MNEIRSKKILPEKQIHQIFWNIEGILKISDELQKELKTSDDVVPVFLTFVSAFLNWIVVLKDKQWIYICDIG